MTKQEKINLILMQLLLWQNPNTSLEDKMEWGREELSKLCEVRVDKKKLENILYAFVMKNKDYKFFNSLNEQSVREKLAQTLIKRKSEWLTQQPDK